MHPSPATPRKIWAAFILMGLGVVVSGFGYWRSQDMTGDFQPIAFMLVSLGWGVVFSIAGIVCTILGARPTPRSTATKIAIVLAGLFSAAAASVTTFLIRIFFAE